ncbi:PCI-domain-containing protein [Laetiporus sulphureus 93-53]|uniref:Eukaryotic translation initiation factor 3 subunit M n=1 Tax=Laetiporus sulphureus 93-53 TaxID=1314785 RepID=A0A165DU19_9APHY|nr:PCI-domain-containing protein [Laetiporus sulphureus 93-53]KZT05631.1 PCI-domain-containing protein [Laetiporus sulphureus 93-53]
MVATDSVSVFAEGTFSEQIRELVDYLARGRPEEERPAYVQPFTDILETAEGQPAIEEDEARRKNVFTMVLGEVNGLGDGSEKEIEGFFNLLFAHFITLLPLDSSDAKARLVSLLQTIAGSPDQSIIKYRILSNFFNALPRRSNLRLLVYKTLLELASTHDELELLGLSRGDVEKWASEWDISVEEKSEFLQSVASAYTKSGQPEIAFGYTLSYVRSLPSSSPNAQTAAVDAIVDALRLPLYFDFDAFFRLDAVVAAKDHELFSLLQIFLNDGLPEYKAWEEGHADAFAKYGLERPQLERKVRLLSLATLGFQNIGHHLPYSTIASTLQVEQSDVERWVIDVIRAGLLSGRLSQTSQTLHVTRAGIRAFERPQWELLEKRLLAWKTGLAGVLDVIADARRKGGAEAVASTSTASPAGTEVPVPAPTPAPAPPAAAAA